MGFGYWGLSIGNWGLRIGPNPQSPIPNPHYLSSHIINIYYSLINQKFIIRLYIYKHNNFNIFK